MTQRWVRTFFRFLVVFGALLVLWQGALALSLLRPTLIDAGVVASSKDRTVEGFHYPALGIEAPVTVAAETSPLKTESWSEIRTALTMGVSLAFDSASFAEAPLAFLTGHSSDTYPHAYSTVFAPLGQAEIGDSFALAIEGVRQEYRVISKSTLLPTDVSGFQKLAPAGGPSRVALVTCWPPLTTQQRLVVLGERVLD